MWCWTIWRCLKEKKKTLILTPLLNILEETELMSFRYVFNLYHTPKRMIAGSSRCVSDESCVHCFRWALASPHWPSAARHQVDQESLWEQPQGCQSRAERVSVLYYQVEMIKALNTDLLPPTVCYYSAALLCYFLSYLWEMTLLV